MSGDCPNQRAEVADALADRRDAVLTEAQGRDIARVLGEFTELLLGAVETDGVDAARSRWGLLAREAIGPTEETTYDYPREIEDGSGNDVGQLKPGARP